MRFLKKPVQDSWVPAQRLTDLYSLRSLNRKASAVPDQNIRPRPQSVPPPAARPDTAQTPPDTPHDSDNFSLRSTSVGGDSRRVSFAEAPRPQGRRIRLPTRGDSLSSGFTYDAKLNKWGVTEAEWEKFSDSLVDACEVPGPSWMWNFRRKEVVARIKKELQYDGDLKRELRRWNKDFKKRGFQVWLELPSSKGEKGDRDLELAIEADGKGEKQAKREARRFRVVVSTTNEKGSSVYSRSSSLTRSVTGEGSIASQPSLDQEVADAEADEQQAEDEGKERQPSGAT